MDLLPGMRMELGFGQIHAIYGKAANAHRITALDGFKNIPLHLTPPQYHICLIIYAPPENSNTLKKNPDIWHIPDHSYPLRSRQALTELYIPGKPW